MLFLRRLFHVKHRLFAKKTGICYNGMDMETLKHYAAENSLRLDDRMLAQFEKYYEMLLDWNQKINLTAITEKSEVEIKHFLDSILPAGVLPTGAELCDVGTGAGFPGIPLKIVRPDLKVTLLDSLNKRIMFLEEVCRALDLADVRCLHARAEEVGQSALRERFDVVTSRAVARLNTLCEYTLPLVRVGGFFLAYKAKCEEELAEADHAIRELGGRLENVDKLLICGQQRTILLIRKEKSTPKKYPRGRGKEKSAPIL